MRSHIRSGLANSPGNLLDQDLEFRGATNRLHVWIFLKQVQEFLGGELTIAVASRDETNCVGRVGPRKVCFASGIEPGIGTSTSHSQTVNACQVVERFGIKVGLTFERTSLGDGLFVPAGPDLNEARSNWWPARSLASHRGSIASNCNRASS